MAKGPQKVGSGSPVLPGLGGDAPVAPPTAGAQPMFLMADPNGTIADPRGAPLPPIARSAPAKKDPAYDFFSTRYMAALAARKKELSLPPNQLPESIIPRVVLALAKCPSGYEGQEFVVKNDRTGSVVYRAVYHEWGATVDYDFPVAQIAAVQSLVSPMAIVAKEMGYRTRTGVSQEGPIRRMHVRFLDVTSLSSIVTQSVRAITPTGYSRLHIDEARAIEAVVGSMQSSSDEADLDVRNYTVINIAMQTLAQPEIYSQLAPELAEAMQASSIPEEIKKDRMARLVMRLTEPLFDRNASDEEIKASLENPSLFLNPLWEKNRAEVGRYLDPASQWGKRVTLNYFLRVIVAADRGIDPAEEQIRVDAMTLLSEFLVRDPNFLIMGGHTDTFRKMGFAFDPQALLRADETARSQLAAAMTGTFVALPVEDTRALIHALETATHDTRRGISQTLNALIPASFFKLNELLDALSTELLKPDDGAGSTLVGFITSCAYAYFLNDPYFLHMSVHNGEMEPKHPSQLKAEAQTLIQKFMQAQEGRKPEEIRAEFERLEIVRQAGHRWVEEKVALLVPDHFPIRARIIAEVNAAILYPKGDRMNHELDIILRVMAYILLDQNKWKALTGHGLEVAFDPRQKAKTLDGTLLDTNRVLFNAHVTNAIYAKYKDNPSALKALFSNPDQLIAEIQAGKAWDVLHFQLQSQLDAPVKQAYEKKNEGESDADWNRRQGWLHWLEANALLAQAKQAGDRDQKNGAKSFEEYKQALAYLVKVGDYRQVLKMLEITRPFFEAAGELETWIGFYEKIMNHAEQVGDYRQVLDLIRKIREIRSTDGPLKMDVLEDYDVREALAQYGLGSAVVAAGRKVEGTRSIRTAEAQFDALITKWKKEIEQADSREKISRALKCYALILKLESVKGGLEQSDQALQVIFRKMAQIPLPAEDRAAFIAQLKNNEINRLQSHFTHAAEDYASGFLESYEGDEQATALELKAASVFDGSSQPMELADNWNDMMSGYLAAEFEGVQFTITSFGDHPGYQLVIDLAPLAPEKRALADLMEAFLSQIQTALHNQVTLVERDSEAGTLTLRWPSPRFIEEKLKEIYPDFNGFVPATEDVHEASLWALSSTGHYVVRFPWGENGEKAWHDMAQAARLLRLQAAAPESASMPRGPASMSFQQFTAISQSPIVFAGAAIDPGTSVGLLKSGQQMIAGGSVLMGGVQTMGSLALQLQPLRFADSGDSVNEESEPQLYQGPWSKSTNAHEAKSLIRLMIGLDEASNILGASRQHLAPAYFARLNDQVAHLRSREGEGDLRTLYRSLQEANVLLNDGTSVLNALIVGHRWAADLSGLVRLSVRFKNSPVYLAPGVGITPTTVTPPTSVPFNIVH